MNREKFGRTFHNNSDSNYILPNDATEYHRLGVQHEGLRLLTGFEHSIGTQAVCEIANAERLEIGTNCLAPFKVEDCTSATLLDICSGSGHWVSDMAREFPTAQIIGIDLSVPDHERQDWPQNAQFIQADITKGLPFGDNSFDLAHMRTVPSLPNRLFILHEIFRVLKPCGVIIFGEPEASFSKKTGKRTPALIEADMLLAQTPHTPRANQVKTTDYSSYSIASTLKKFVQDVVDDKGEHLFTDIQSKVFTIPVGPWPKGDLESKVGRMFAFVQMGLIDSLRPEFLDRKLLIESGFEDLKHRIKCEVEDESLQLQKRFVYVWGRRNDNMYQ